jgi:hypothetical protein
MRTDTERLIEGQRDVTNSVAAVRKFTDSLNNSAPSSHKTKYVSISKPKRRGYNSSFFTHARLRINAEFLGTYTKQLLKCLYARPSLCLCVRMKQFDS